MHHFPGTPDVRLPRHIQLAHNRAIHLAVVAYDDHRLVGQILCAFHLHLRVKELNKPLYHFEAYRSLCYSVDLERVYNPSSKDIWLMHEGKVVMVPSNKEVKL